MVFRIHPTEHLKSSNFGGINVSGSVRTSKKGDSANLYNTLTLIKYEYVTLDTNNYDKSIIQEVSKLQKRRKLNEYCKKI